MHHTIIVITIGLCIQQEQNCFEYVYLFINQSVLLILVALTSLLNKDFPEKLYYHDSQFLVEEPSQICHVYYADFYDLSMAYSIWIQFYIYKNYAIYFIA